MNVKHWYRKCAVAGVVALTALLLPMQSQAQRGGLSGARGNIGGGGGGARPNLGGGGGARPNLGGGGGGRPNLGGGGAAARPNPGNISRPSLSNPGLNARPTQPIARPGGGSNPSLSGISRPNVTAPSRPNVGANRPTTGVNRPIAPGNIGRPDLSRPSLQPPATLPAVRPNLPGQIGGGNRPTLPDRPGIIGGGGNRPTLPDRPGIGGGNRPTLPDRPGIGGGNRPTLPDRPGIGGDRPIVPDRPGIGGGNRPTLPDRPGIGGGNRPTLPDRPGVGGGDRPIFPDRPGLGGGDRPTFPNRPGGDRPGWPERPGGGDRPVFPDRPGIGDRPIRPDRPVFPDRPVIDRPIVDRPNWPNRPDGPIIGGGNNNNNNNNNNNIIINRPNNPNWGWGWGWGWNPGWGGHWNNHRWYHGPWNNHWRSPWYRPAPAFFIGWGLGSWNSRVVYSNPYVIQSTTPSFNYSQPVVINNIVSSDSSATATATAEATAQNEAAMKQFDAGMTAFYEAQFPTALNSFNASLKLLPGDPVVHEMLALTYFALGKYPQSAEILNSLLASAPGMDWTTMSSVYGDIDLYTTQLRALEQYVDANPNNAAAAFVLAYHYLVVGHTDAAIEKLQTVVKLQPKDVTAQRMLGALQRDASARAETKDDGQTTDLVGRWLAKADDVNIELKITDDSQFTWVAKPTGKPPVELAGSLAAEGNMIALETEGQGTMMGRVKSGGDDKFQFIVPGGPPDDMGLTFVRQN
ncbi:Tetratricopeptide repeat protein [Anatilimnocola aggregata]|uniref:Tetratricopeptide repeat protein n=1 Tax=Anatilimnocola aggregata TaxID=2528021 RepID=A0A517YNF9_9BACT|nr:tetratricopeptide repeat protein [Anatilimnocola aggregata]QDU31754.1 Tetratricopeptide repeat protein [Anatilimnocola aggregata]